MKQRYGTWFFVTAMCLPDRAAGPKAHGLWINPEKGLAGKLAGEILLNPPTLITLHELLQYANLQDLAKEWSWKPTMGDST